MAEIMIQEFTVQVDEEAARVYDAKALELLVDKARLNFPQEAPT